MVNLAGGFLLLGFFFFLGGSEDAVAGSKPVLN